jgi:hypothetical protein
MGTTGIALSSSAPSLATYAGTWGTTGYGTTRTLKFTHVVTFANGSAARYFFNAGGTLSLTHTKTGGSATTRNADWAALAAACGTTTIGYKNTTKTGGSGSTNILLNATNGGYWNTAISPAAPTTHFVQYDASAGYTTDYIQVNATLSGTVSAGGYPVITIDIYWVNADVNAWQDSVDGTTTTSLVVNSPATTYLTNSWGTPVLTVPVAGPV